MKAAFNAKAFTIFGYLGALIPDASDRYIEAFCQAAGKCGLEPPLPVTLREKLGGKRLAGIIDDLYGGLADIEKLKFFEACNKARSTLLATERLRPGVPEALAALKNEGHILGLFTASLEPMEAVLSHHGIRQFFMPQLIAQDGEATSVDPLALKTKQLAGLRDAFVKTCGNDKAMTVISGTASGCRAAKMAGIDVLAYAACDDSRMLLQKADPALIVFTDYKDLPGLMHSRRMSPCHAPVDGGH